MRWENGARNQNSCSRAGRTGPARYHLRFLEIRAPLLESVTQERTRRASRAGGGGQEKSMSQQHMLPLSAPPPSPLRFIPLQFLFWDWPLNALDIFILDVTAGPRTPFCTRTPSNQCVCLARRSTVCICMLHDRAQGSQTPRAELPPPGQDFCVTSKGAPTL